MTFREKMKDGTTRITGGGPLAAWPVSSIYMGYTDTNPSILLGGGTWIRFAVGRMLIGVDETDGSFDVAGETGGEKTHTLTTSEIPVHTHNINHAHDISHTHAAGSAGSAGGHTHNVTRRDAAGAGGGVAYGGGAISADIATSSDGAHTHVVTVPTFVGSTGYVGSSGNEGGGQAHNNMPPYISVYIWRRTA